MSEVIEFPLKKEISGPITMDAEAFKANLAAAYSAGAMMMRERAAKAVEHAPVFGKKDGPDKDASNIITLDICMRAIRALSQSPSGKDM